MSSRAIPCHRAQGIVRSPDTWSPLARMYINARLKLRVSQKEQRGILTGAASAVTTMHARFCLERIR
jgi:hypothetical protein